MNPAAIATVGLFVIAAAGLLAGGIAWFYRRGRQEQSLTSSINRLDETGNRQAKAAEELAAQVGGLRDTIEKHSGTLVEHHWRIKRLEEQ